MKWSKEAEAALSRVPFFVKKRVKNRVEDEARQSGARKVTLNHVRACQQRFLNRMQDEVRGYQIETCFGGNGCSNQAVNGGGLSQKLEKRIEKRDLKAFLKEKVDGPLKMHHEFRISISKCPNACSRPQIVDIGLVGACNPEVSNENCNLCQDCVAVCKEDAVFLSATGPVIDASKCLACGQCISVCPTGTLKKGETGYRVFVGGKLGRHPRLGHELPGIFNSHEMARVLDTCLDYYQAHCLNGERLGAIMEREGATGIEEQVLNRREDQVIR